MINNIEGQSKSELIKIVTEQQEHDIQREAYIKSLQSESDALREQLAKANERLQNSEQVRTEYSFLIADLVRRADVKNDLYKNPTYKKAIDQLNKFAIENQVEAINAVLDLGKLYTIGEVDQWAIDDAKVESFIEQLRKEQE